MQNKVIVELLQGEIPTTPKNCKTISSDLKENCISKYLCVHTAKAISQKFDKKIQLRKVEKFTDDLACSSDLLQIVCLSKGNTYYNHHHMHIVSFFQFFSPVKKVC